MSKIMMIVAIVCVVATCVAGPVDDLAQKKVVSASDNLVNAERCVDGSRSETGWDVATKDAKPWIQIDLGKSREIGCVVLVWGKDFASDYVIATSNDGEKFKQVATKKDENGFVDAVGFETEKARFVRLAIEKSPSDKINLRAFEVYEGREKQSVIKKADIGNNEKSEVKGQLLREWTFDNPTDWREAQFRDVYPDGFLNNYTWGKKDIEVRPCQGVTGAGLLINIRGISQGQMQFWTAPWPLVRHKFYKITFKAKVENLNGGGVGVMVRRAVKAWTRLVEGPGSLPLTEDWQEFSFSGPGKTDIDNDFGVMFSSSGIGKIYLDDIRVESFDENPKEIVIYKNTNPVVEGNIFPNSSFEIERNKLWSTAIVQNDPMLHSSDPGFVRAEGGKFGKHCFAFQPVITTEKYSINTKSIDIPVASGVPYTFSFWYRGKGKAWGTVSIGTGKVNGEGVSKYCALREPKTGWTDEWQRIVLTTDPVPSVCNKMNVAFSKAGPGEIYIDGMQLEAGDKATDYKPSHPYEIEATVKGGMPNIVSWGEKIELELSAYKATDEIADAKIPAILKLVAYPNETVCEKKVVLETGKKIPIALDPIENGIFRIELTSDDSKMASVFENIAARLPTPRDDVDLDSFFGAHISVRPYFLNYAHRIGIKWQRMHDCSNITKMKWGNPKKDVYQWHDKSIDMIRDAKLNILGMPDYFSNFAKRTPKDKELVKTTFGKNNDDCGENPIDIDAFTNWCTRVADHYKGRIDYWEVVNEPYINYFYPGNATQYAEVFEAGMKALRKGNNKAKIVGWCTELKTDGFFEDLPKEKISDIDVLSFHAYFTSAPGGGTMSLKADLDALKEKVSKVRDPGEYWNTEGSWGGFKSLFYTFNPKDNLAEKHISVAAADSRLWIEQKKAGFSKFFFYTLHQTDTLSYRGGYKNLIDYDRTITTGAAATAVTAWFIDGLDPKPFVQREGAVESLFSGKGRTSYVVYDDGLYAGAFLFDISKLPSDYLVCDVMGTDLRKAKLKKVKLGSTPIFVLANTSDYDKMFKVCQNALVE